MASDHANTPQPQDPSNAARILVGVPAFRGTDHIAETLRAIQAQDFTAFECLISVDNGDCATADACAPFLSDPRFRVVVQEQRLHWAGNFNWLLAQLRHDYFCYWPQDDLATPDYLGHLIRAADAHPDCVCTFADIEWFGAGKAHLSFPSLDGPPLTRALYVFESLNGVPFRGLVRRDVVARVGGLRKTDFQSAHEEFVWLAKVAREGKLGRVAGPLYMKRRHDDSLSLSWHQRDAAWRRGMWIEFGVGMLEAMLPAAPVHEREALLVVVLERLCCPKDGRVRFYDPLTEPTAFAGDFLRGARARCGIMALSPAADDEIIRATLKPWLGADAAETTAALSRNLSQSGNAEIGFKAGDAGTQFLHAGWSVPEAWGTWNGAPSATLMLPLPADGQWTIVFLCRGYAEPGHPQSIHVEVDDTDDIARWQFESLDNRWQRLTMSPHHATTTIRFRFPDAVAPLARGRNDDTRPLALALIAAKISRA